MLLVVRFDVIKCYLLNEGAIVRIRPEHVLNGV
jgi:hypothetical protein